MLTAQREAEEKEREAEEKEREAEDARKQTQFISESAAIRTELERKKREVERLEEIKKHNAAQARLNIFSDDQYDEVEHQSAILTEQGQDIYPSPLKVPVSLHQPSTLNPVSNPLYPAQQTIHDPPYHPHIAAVTKTSPQHPSTFTSNYTPQPASFLQSPMVHQAILPQPPTVQQVPLTKAPTTHSPTFTTTHEASNDLVRTLAEAITANRIPIPEDCFIANPILALSYSSCRLLLLK